jgi:hypothetical protein
MSPIVPEISVVLPQDDQSGDAVVRAVVGQQVLVLVEAMPGPQALAVACAMRQLVQQTLALNGIAERVLAQHGPEESYAPAEPAEVAP